MRLRDVPGLLAKLDKTQQQLRGYVDRFRRPEKRENPYSSAGKKKRKRVVWE